MFARVFALQRYHLTAVADYAPKVLRAVMIVRVTAIIAAGFE
jgi:hypothetical protein